MDNAPTSLFSNDGDVRDRLAAAMAAAGFAPGFIGRLPRHGLSLPPEPAEASRLVMVDLGPDPADGLDWCRLVRNEHPRVLLCAVVRGPDPLLAVTALEQGADAVIHADAGPRELAAQLRALARRRTPPPADADLVLDPTHRRAVVAGRVLDLTDAEFELLAVLFRHRGCVLTRDELSRELRGRPYEAADRSLDLRVTRLRRKLGDDTHAPHWIRSVRGEGYLLLPPPA